MRTMKVTIAYFDVNAGHYLDDMIYIRDSFKLRIESKLSERKNLPDRMCMMDKY
jgi:hypothetical protein